jgi:uncharacterized Zn-binding protein involved in type VI secretion
MDHRVTHPRFNAKKLVVRSGDGAPSVTIDGRPVSPTGGAFIVRDDTDQAAQVEVGAGMNGEPFVKVDGQVADLQGEIPWYGWVLAGIPFLLVFVGGLIGGLCGGGGASLIMVLFRSKLSTVVKIAGSLAIMTASFVLWLTLVVALQLAVGG